MVANAARDTDTGKYYHPDCAPEVDTIELVEVDGFVCESCGGPIDQDDEDDEETRTLDQEED